MNKHWKRMPGLDKVLLLLRIGLGIAVVLLACFQFFKVMDRAVDLAVPVLGANLLAQAAHEWKQNRIEAIVSVCVAVFIFGVSVVVWFGK